MALADWYRNTYTHVELAELLAAYALNGEQPPVPDDTAIVVAPRQPGRPSVSEREAHLLALQETLMSHYPVQLDVAFLSGQTGMTRNSVIKLTQDPKFLRTLPLHIRTYFQAMPLKSFSRLPALWRGVLDLHYYTLLTSQPVGVSKPHFYTWHAALWGDVPNFAGRAHRDLVELDRAYTPALNDLLFEAGLPQAHPIPRWGDEPFDAPCPGGNCPITRAWANSDNSIMYVDGARALLQVGPQPLAWPEVRPGTIIDATTTLGVVRQVLGVH